MSKADRKEVLDLLANGKITADEAAQLLSQPTEPAAPSPPTPPEPVVAVEEVEPVAKIKTAIAIEIDDETDYKAENTGKPQWFKVRVTNMETGKNKVSVNIPLRMMQWGIRLGSQFTDELKGLKLDEMQHMMGEKGMLVEVMDEDSNEHVQVYLE